MSRRIRIVARLAVALALAAALAPAGAAAAPARRIAVVVGANEAPSGRTTLRYAHADARNLAATLIDVAGFARDDVHVLLDPAPAEVLGGIDAALATLAGSDEALLFFYFSGHSDAAALYPGGRALPLPELKRRLEDPRASVRVGVVDACSGGAWTGAKGVRPAEPFVVEVPFALGAEGSALLAASSGAENAHEYERLGGSFFTHHLVAGLRGGAERDGDGVVSLGEAFEYAKAGTLRDSALHAAAPQHPSFVMNLRGRSDLPLARLAGSPTRVELEQTRGPLQVIRLDQALVVLEVPPGPRRLTLALAPGNYLVRRRTGGETFAAEVQVVSGRAVTVREESLVLVGAPTLAAKGPTELPAALRTSLPGGGWEVQLLAGRHDDDAVAWGDGTWFAPGLAVGLTDRLQLTALPTLQLAYRLGTAGRLELLAHAGIDGLVVTDEDGLLLVTPVAGVVLRLPIGADDAFVAGVSVGSSIWFTDSTDLRGRSYDSFEERLVSTRAGLVVRLFDRVTLSPGLELQLDRGRILEDSDAAFTIGSTVDLARGARPLVQVELGEGFTVDGHAALTQVLLLDGEETITRWGLGFTWTF